MIRSLKLRYGSGVVNHDDTVSESTIRTNVPAFFRVKGGNQRYVFYRGAVIVRITRTLTNCRPERLTIVYLYFPDLEGRPHTFWLDDANNIRHAKRIIDQTLEKQSLEKS